MRILQFSDSFYPIMDGVGHVAFQYAMNMGLKGHECYVITAQEDTGFRGRWPFEVVDYVGVPLFRMKSYKVGAPFLDRHCQKRLGMIQGDIVHVHCPFIAGQVGISYGQKHDLPIVGSFHSKYYDDFLQITGVELLAEAGVKYVVDFYRKCTEVWAVSHSSAETLRGYGYTGEIRVMPNGTDIPELSPEAAAALPRKLPLTGEPILLYVGQMNWKKNIRCTLEAAARLTHGFQLVLAGQGPHEKEIRDAANSLGLRGRILFAGHIIDHDMLNALYARASLFVFPSVYDTSGLVVREAAAMGTPSVVVRGSSAAEALREGENALLCENDPADLARVIDRALADPAGLDALGRRAKATVPIPWSTLVDDVLDRYRALCGQ